MKMPPYLVGMRIVAEGRTKFHFWFPLFLLWPVALPFVALTLLGTALVDGFRFLAGRKGTYTRLAIGALGIVGETRGTEVLVEDATRTVAFRLR
jgi:hypothetical protein